MADKPTLSKEYTDKGWQLAHAQPARTANDSPTGAAEAGHFIALKRDPTVQGEGPVEIGAQSLEQIEYMISEWERARPGDPNDVPQLDEEALLNSAKATLHMSVTAGARPAVDVDLTPAVKKAEPKATRLAAAPEITEIKLDEQTQRGIAEGPNVTSGKTTGVGDGTTPGESSAGAGRKTSTSRKSGSRKSSSSKK